MKAIVAVDLNWGIGYNGKLLQRISEDMKRFKRITTGKVVIMGRETFESLPGKEPLKDRINIVLTQNRNFNDERVIICRSMDELFKELEKYQPEDVYVIGGESVYTQLLPYCDEVLVTKIENTYTADKHYPNLDKDEDWELESSSEPQSHNDIQFSYLKYVNKTLDNY